MISFNQILNNQIKNVWIYGAGKIGTKVLQKMAIIGVNVKGFVVSRYDGKIIPGINILEMEEVTTKPDETVFIITTPVSAYQEVKENIQKYGYDNIVIWDDECEILLWQKCDYKFIDRRKKLNKCLFVLAGYKEFLWDSVFGRIEQYVPKDIDVCIMSSGIYSDKLDKLCEVNNWSYLSTYQNSVTLVQNIAFSLYAGYEWVYKLDEDIFVTKNSFDKLYDCYTCMERQSNLNVGVVAPLIPINGYGYNVLLKKYDLEKEYEQHFGPIRLGGNPSNELEKNPEAALFLWDKLPKIDEINKELEENNIYNICGVRFSIGFILLRHTIWNQMHAFNVSGNSDMGFDEEELCEFCINNSRPIVVAENTVVGHFSFGKQTELMKQYYIDNKYKF